MDAGVAQRQSTGFVNRMLGVQISPPAPTNAECGSGNAERVWPAPPGGSERAGGSAVAVCSTFPVPPSALRSVVRFPSGQRGRTVNPLAQPSVVRIHPSPPAMGVESQERQSKVESAKSGRRSNIQSQRRAGGAVLGFVDFWTLDSRRWTYVGGRSSTAEPRPSKPVMWVRFPSPAPSVGGPGKADPGPCSPEEGARDRIFPLTGVGALLSCPILGRWLVCASRCAVGDEGSGTGRAEGTQRRQAGRSNRLTRGAGVAQW